MSGLIIAFPMAQAREPAPDDPYDFWFEFLADLEAGRRRDAIQMAHRCGLIDDRDRHIFETSPWGDGGKAA